MNSSDGAVEYQVLSCPSCGAPFSLEHVRTEVVCAYCGSHIRVRRRETAEDGTLPVKDAATGQVLAHVRIPFGWELAPARLDYSNPSFEYPMCVLAEARSDTGAIIRYRSGEAFADRSAMFATGKGNGGVNVVERAFPGLAAYIDEFAQRYVGANGSALRFVEERPLPLYEPLDKAAGRGHVTAIGQREIARQTTGDVSFSIAEVFFDGAARIYALQMPGAEELRIAVATCVEGCTTQIMTGGMGGLLGGLDLGAVDFGKMGENLAGNDFVGGLVDKGLLGGIIGKRVKEARSQRQAAQQQTQQSGFQPVQSQQSQQPQQPAETPLKRHGAMQLVGWQSRHLFILQAPVAAFEEAYENAFTDFCSTMRIDDALNQQVDQIQQRLIDEEHRRGAQQLAAQQQQFQAYQQAHAAQVAAFDSYNKSWWDRQNSSYASSRNAYQARMANEDRIRERYSEATRGVNTYLRPDGSEVELSVGADTAWSNNRGDVIGGSAGFDPGSSWTQLNRKW